MIDDKQAQLWNEEAVSDIKDSAGRSSNGRWSRFTERQRLRVAAGGNYTLLRSRNSHFMNFLL